MYQSIDRMIQVEAQLSAPLATMQLVRFQFDGPVDGYVQDGTYHLDLSLTPRPKNSRAGFPDHWGSRRFEKLGKLFLVPGGESLYAKSEGACEQASVICQVHPEPMREWFDDDLRWDDHALSSSLDIREGNIHNLMLRLLQELKAPGFASDVLVELVAGQVVIELARYCTAIKDSPVSGGLAPWRLRLIDERLKEEPRAPTLAELAELCRLSPRQLARGFRASRGQSIGDYVAQARLENARELLTTDLSVKSIAYTLGFSSPSSFCYAFRKASGETPRQFRCRLLGVLARESQTS